MKATLSIFFSIFLSITVSAQFFQSVKHIGGAGGSGYGTDMAIDTSGNLYLTGSFLGTVNFNLGGIAQTITATGQNDLFVQKVDPSGTTLWGKAYG